MSISSSMRAGLRVACMALGIAGPVLAGDDVATTQVSPGSITWYPSGSFESLSLRVSGGADNGVVEKTSQGGVLSVSSAELSDGIYTYELRATPQGAGALRAQKDAAEAAGSSNEVARLAGEIHNLYANADTVQSGAFNVTDGLISESSSEQGE